MQAVHGSRNSQPAGKLVAAGNPPKGQNPWRGDQWPEQGAVGIGIGGECDSDVVLVRAGHTLLFEPQNARASEWLHQRCGLAGEDSTGDTEIRVHPTMRGKIVAELKAAGFQIAKRQGRRPKPPQP